MKTSIFRAICFATASVFAASLILTMGVLYGYFSKGQQEQLKTQTGLVAQAVEKEGLSYFEGIALRGIRITWIAGDGSVLYDSDSSLDRMENHLGRKEVKEALSFGYGQSERYSKTLFERQIYAAKKLLDGSVVRLSSTHLTVVSLALALLRPALVVGITAVALAFLLATSLSKKIVKPLYELDLDQPQKGGYEELAPFFERVACQKSQLQLKESMLRQKQEEFRAATDYLSEGLILLNEKGIILSINRAASSLLSISSFCVGKDILLLHNSLSMQELLREAKSGSHAKAQMELGGVMHQMNASPVVSDGEVTGIALLIFDISDKEKAEKMRREFTANVSHELKTPLQSICGYAELMKEGVVKQEDMGRFSDRIYVEARRMTALLEDILKLSRLDEGIEGIKEMKWGETDLYDLANDAIHALRPLADEAGVSIALEGGHVKVNGEPQLLSGVFYNLCENAIKYNRENGSVSVEIREEGTQAELIVSDTGIGIAGEHMERIFERFYRVDKSHSKEVGGTGLGLSIVKHSVKLHNGWIEVQSVVDGGTTVIVRLPK